MLINKKTGERKKSTDCTECEFFKNQSCTGLGERCVEDNDQSTLVAVIDGGKSDYLILDKVKFKDGKTVGDMKKEIEDLKAEIVNIYKKLNGAEL